jgi:hypothetical protein
VQKQCSPALPNGHAFSGPRARGLLAAATPNGAMMAPPHRE